LFIRKERKLYEYALYVMKIDGHKCSGLVGDKSQVMPNYSVMSLCQSVEEHQGKGKRSVYILLLLLSPLLVESVKVRINLNHEECA
jgi:hypothetical protein